LSGACILNCIDKFQELFAGRKLQSFLADLHPRKRRRRIIKRAPLRIASSKIARNVPMLLLTTLGEYCCWYRLSQASQSR
jgi:hypothetical protein